VVGEIVSFIFFLPHILVLALATFVFWRGSTPSSPTRQQIAQLVEAKGLKSIDLRVSWKAVHTDRNQVTFAARCRNPFGNVQKEYFSVNLWANALGRGTPVPAIRF
jgi:hypothetical protein